jgi:hypothetical protein
MRQAILSIVLVAAVLALAGASAAAGVTINELMADPASDWSPSDGNEEYHSMEDEWIEIYNDGPEAIDITGWRLRDAVSDSSWRFGFEGAILSGEIIVVYGNESYAWEEANGFAKNGLSMNNSGDTMTLVEADLTTVADQVTYEPFQVLDDRSYGRLPDGGEDWAIYDALNPLDPPETGLPPTPGTPNVGSPVEAARWGGIKALYR